MFKILLVSFALFSLPLFSVLRYDCVEITTKDPQNEKIEIILGLTDEGLVYGNGFRNQTQMFAFSWIENFGISDLEQVIDHLQELVAMNNQATFTGVINTEGKRQAFLQTTNHVYFLDHPNLQEIRPSAMNHHDEIIVYGQNANEMLECYLWTKTKGFEKVTFPSGKNDGIILSFNDQRQMLLLNIEKGIFSVIKQGKSLCYSDARFYLLGLKLNQKGDVVGSRISKRNEQISGMIWCANGKKIEVKKANADIILSDLNDHREAVGELNIEDEETQQAILWTEDEGLVILNDVIDPNNGYTLTSAIKINARGQIVAEGRNAHDEEIIVLLNPKS